MTHRTIGLFRRGMGILVPFSLLILIFTGCVSQQEIRARKSVARAGDAYVKAKADSNVEANASAVLTEAGRMLQEAGQTADFKKMEQLSYLSEKKTQTAVTISEGKVIEKLSLNV